MGQGWLRCACWLGCKVCCPLGGLGWSWKGLGAGRIRSAEPQSPCTLQLAQARVQAESCALEACAAADSSVCRTLSPCHGCCNAPVRRLPAPDHPALD